MVYILHKCIHICSGCKINAACISMYNAKVSMKVEKKSKLRVL